MKKIYFLYYVLWLIAVLIFSKAEAQDNGMYGIEGWAASTSGGRGGAIVRVNNLNASGEGSLADALKLSGARIIVFEVGGVINLNGGSINISKPYVTVAGQTAPSPGITIINGKLNVSTHDVILQHIAIRPGAMGHETGWEPDGLSTIAGHHVVIDHCSFSWAVDENCSASGERFKGNNVEEWRMNTSHDVTISNNIIAEGLAHATHSKGLHSMGSLIHDNVTNVAILRNLYSCNNARNPLFKAGAMGVVVNNYIYNPGNSGVRYGYVANEWEGHTVVKGKMSIIGNWMQLGPSSSKIAFMQATNSPCSIFLSNNTALNTSGNNLQQYKGDASNLVSARPIWNDNITIMKSSATKAFVLNHAGARPWDRDAIDSRIIKDAQNGTGSIINFETEVGGLPDYAQTNASFIEEQWNLDYMLQIAPEIQLSTDAQSDTVYVDSIYHFSVNLNEALFASNFVELLVNGQSLGKQYQEPFAWNFQPDSTGTYKFIVITETDDFNLLASESIELTVLNSGVISELKNISASESIGTLNIYPNPFNKSTQIEYYLPQTQKITISVYNTSGQVVETLRNETETEGKHQIIWNPQNLASGSYFIKLVSEKGVLNYKIMYTQF